MAHRLTKKATNIFEILILECTVLNKKQMIILIYNICNIK